MAKRMFDTYSAALIVSPATAGTRSGGRTIADAIMVTTSTRAAAGRSRRARRA